MAKDDIKFTRKELKEDELVTFSAKALKWLEENRKPVLTGIISLIVIIILYYSVTGFVRYRAEKASNEYMEASELIAPKSRGMTEADTPSKEDIKSALSKFEAIYNKYGFTGVGKISLLRIAQLNYDLKEYDQTSKSIREFLSKMDSNDPLYISGLLLLANISYAKGDFPEAVNSCEKILKGSSDFLKDEALFISAKAFIKQDKKEDARNRLKELTEKYQSSHLKNEATALMKSL